MLQMLYFCGVLIFRHFFPYFLPDYVLISEDILLYLKPLISKECSAREIIMLENWIRPVPNHEVNIFSVRIWLPMYIPTTLSHFQEVRKDQKVVLSIKYLFLAYLLHVVMTYIKSYTNYNFYLYLCSLHGI